MDSKGIAQSVIVAAGLIGGLGLLGSQLSDGINAFVDPIRGSYSISIRKEKNYTKLCIFIHE